MNKLLLLILPSAMLLASCSSVDEACEDVTLASEQIQECQALHKRIISNKGDILIRSELERRYQQDCIDIRYHRDDLQPAKCGNKHKIDEIRESIKTESQQ